MRFDLNESEGPGVQIKAIVLDLTFGGDHATVLP
jgi:hypothetical protein